MYQSIIWLEFPNYHNQLDTYLEYILNFIYRTFGDSLLAILCTVFRAGCLLYVGKGNKDKVVSN